MLGILILLFCVVPFVELWLLLTVAHQTSPLFTLLLVVGTGIVGASLARWQGFQVLRRIERESSAGRMPATALVDGAMILAAGLLLLTPGILTDLFGFSLLIPPVRAIYRRLAIRYFKNRVKFQQVDVGGFDPRTTGQDEIIDVQVIDSRRSSNDAGND